jgi:uroporphyrinogen-III decarboxylase
MLCDVTFHPSWWYDRAGICFGRDFFDDPEYRMKADLAMRRELFERFGIGRMPAGTRPILGSDLLAMGFLHSQILGCEVTFSDQAAPAVHCRNLSLEEAARLEVPDLDHNAVWQGVQRQIDYLITRFGYVEPAINLMGIQNIALDLLGQELFIQYYETPEVINHVLDVATQLSIDIGKRLKALSPQISPGVTSIISQIMPEAYITSNCSVEMVSLDLYEDFLLKYDRILGREFIPFAIHHCGKTCEHVIEGYAKADNLAFVEVGAFSDIGAVRKAVPNITLNARYSPVRLRDVSVRDMRDEIKKMYRDGAPAELLSVSCVGIDNTVSDDKVRSFLAACREL